MCWMWSGKCPGTAAGVGGLVVLRGLRYWERCEIRKTGCEGERTQVRARECCQKSVGI